MGAALITGLFAAGMLQPSDVAIVEVIEAQRAVLADRYPHSLVTGEIPRCRSALIAVKPNDTAAATAAAVAAGASRILSVAAGVTLAQLEAAAGPGVAVIRSMPNTPALVGKGASALAAGLAASADDVAWAHSILAVVGIAEVVPEALLDAVTGLTGSGPAYLFLIAEALVDAGVLVGLPRSTAEILTAQLLVGSAELLSQRGNAAGLRAMVTSPGGTTAAGLRVLEDRAVRGAIQAAVVAATERSRELGFGAQAK